MIDGVILTIALPLTGRIGEFWKSPLAKPWMATLVMMCLAAAAGTYPGRSVPFILQYGFRFHVLPFYVVAIACTTRRVRYLMKWIAAGGVLLLLLCADSASSLEDRFALARDFAFQSQRSGVFAGVRDGELYVAGFSPVRDR